MSEEPSEVASWLARIGMSKFADTFISNGLELDLLPEVTSQDLLEIGVTRLVDRKAIMKEIRQLTLEKARHSVERRVLSVFFCDMVGSTARSTEIDPEELRSEMKLYQDAVVAAVNRHGGFVARFMGDGVLAYFGWPHADEDQASQAVRAGLDAIATVGELTFGAGTKAQCRIGIATGRVVVGGQQDLDSAFGETPNLAARLQSLAEVDGIVIDSTTRRAIGNRFVVDNQQDTPLKGFDQPVPVWNVVKERKFLDRFESRGGGSSAFVGREEQLKSLRRAWISTQSGRGCAVELRGEPGIGKSRLLKQFCEAMLPEGTLVQQYQCSSHYINSAFHPVIQQLENAAGVDAARDGDAEKAEKVKLLMHPTLAEDDLSLALIVDLLSTGGIENPLLAGLTPLERRSQTVETLIANVLLKANGGATVLVIEDAHWIDPSSKLLLESALAQIKSAPILILVTTRQGNHFELPPSAEVVSLHLPPLEAGSIGQLAKSVDTSSVLSSDDIDNIVGRADGIPLFAEEIALAAIESGSRGETFELPESIEASLAARLDNLGDAKLAIQVASVIGREFQLPQLQTLAATEDSTLLAAMGRAMAAGLVLEVNTASDRAFRFTHALVQDVAYNGLLKKQRRDFHRRFAIDVLGDTVRQREPELIALHLTSAGEPTLAIEYWKEAAYRSAGVSANAESINHFQQGLALVSGLPDGQTRDQLEFALLVGLAQPLIAEKGYTSEELERCIGDALNVGKKISYTPDIYSLLFSQWGFKLTVGMMEDSRRVALEFSELAEQQNDEVALYARHRMLGASHMCLGELDLAKKELTKLVEDYRPEQHAALRAVYGADLRVAGRCFLSEVLWLLGEVELAKTSAAAALSEARKMQHVHSHALSLHFCSLISFLDRDREQAKIYSDELLMLATQHPLGAWPTLGRAMNGWATMTADNFESKFEDLIQGVAQACELGVSMFIPFFYCRIAEELIRVDRLSEADDYLNQAQQLMSRTGENLYRGELLQLMAQVRSSEKDGESADHLYSEGLAHAISIGATSVELRIANNYARFLSSRGDNAKARALLTEALLRKESTGESADRVVGTTLLSQIESIRPTLH
ncbi:MAG: AAA family ATPase [Halioglobus sp.]